MASALRAKVRARAGQFRSYRCPANAAHGPLISWSGLDGRDWFCPHSEHEIKNTQRFFSEAEAAAGQRTDA